MHVLVKCRSTAEKCAVIHAHMPSQQAIVRDDDVVPDRTIVADMRPRHQKIVISEFCDTTVGAATMNRTIFANDVVVSDFDLRSCENERSCGGAPIIAPYPIKLPVPIATSPSMTTCDCTIDLSPIIACAPITENGPISTSAPSCASGATSAVG